MIEKIKFLLLKIKPLQDYVLQKKLIDNYKNFGESILNNSTYLNSINKSINETKKNPSRTDILNYLISILNRETTYLEIGVRNPEDNFNKIKSKVKYSVDPGVEFKDNPVDFQMTSDSFFESIKKGEILDSNIKFDIIFIDGLHLANQVDRDIRNSLEYIKDDGFIVLHDCNPPTEWHARIDYNYHYTPAEGFWNGTTWKAFVKWKNQPNINSCCIDTDWGVGILSKKQPIGNSNNVFDEFYEFDEFEKNRKEFLNLIDYKTFQNFF